MTLDRRTFLAGSMALGAAAAWPPGHAVSLPGVSRLLSGGTPAAPRSRDRPMRADRASVRRPWAR